MTPGGSHSFCPVRKSAVKWNEKDVNLAVAVRNDIFYCSGHRTASANRAAPRIGLAWSTDGLHFTKRRLGAGLVSDNDALQKNMGRRLRRMVETAVAATL